MEAFSPAELQRIRAETPGVVAAGGKGGYFNNAGAALMPQVVLDAQIQHLQREAVVGGYAAAKAEGCTYPAATGRVEAVYGSIATLIGAHPDEIALVENATAAWMMAFYSIAATFKPGDRILTAACEYAANYVAYLQVCQRTGAVVEVIPSRPTGETDPAALAAMLDGTTEARGPVKLISITHVPTNGGLVNPAAEIGKIARAARVPFLLDACQSVGQLSLDVEALGCDLLSATGRKYLRGPRGSGFLFCRRSLLDAGLEPAMIDHHGSPWVSPAQFQLRSDARRFENWEFNYAAVLGLGAAVDYCLGLGIDRIERRISSLSRALRVGLAALDIVVVTDIGSVQCGIVSFTVTGFQSPPVAEQLQSGGFEVSISNPSSTLIDATERKLGPLLRASVHYYNTKDEIVAFVKTLAGLINSEKDVPASMSAMSSL